AAVTPGKAANPSGTAAQRWLPPRLSASAMGWNACRPPSSASQKAATPEPIGDTTPMPVTATWFIACWRLTPGWIARAVRLERCGLPDECSPLSIVPARDRLDDQRTLYHTPADAHVVVRRAQEAEIHERLAHPQAHEPQTIHSGRQPGIEQPQPVLERIGLEPEQADEGIGHGRCRPSLRAAGDRVADRMTLVRAALEAGVELRQPVRAQTAGRILQRREDPL